MRKHGRVQARDTAAIPSRYPRYIDAEVSFSLPASLSIPLFFYLAYVSAGGARVCAARSVVVPAVKGARECSTGQVLGVALTGEVKKGTWCVPAAIRVSVRSLHSRCCIDDWKGLTPRRGPDTGPATEC